MGIAHGAWRLTFLAVYFSLVYVSVHGLRDMPEPSLSSLLVMHGIWVVYAVYVAGFVNRQLCAHANDYQRAQYGKQLMAAAKSLPVEAYRVDPDTREVHAIRRQLLEPRLGLTARR